MSGATDGLVRPVMEQHPSAWMFFVPFIIMTKFTVFNRFIALMRKLDTLTEEVKRLRRTVART